MAMVMLGAMFQLVPVISGQLIPGGAAVASLVHAFLLAVGSLLLRRVGGGDSIFCIRFAVLALLITVALGLLRSANYAGLVAPVYLANSANIHLAWGLGGWALLLVMGASYQVIPMFHVTPSYPTSLARAARGGVSCTVDAQLQ